MKTGLYASPLSSSQAVLARAQAVVAEPQRHVDPTEADAIGLLEAQTQDLSAYAHTVAHDLKDPLAVIIATSDAIFHITDLTSEELYAYLQQIRSTAREMNGLIDHLLLFSEVSDAEVSKVSLDMATIVGRVRKRLEYLAWEYNAEITTPRTWPSALGYAPWVEEVWANLISNGVKHGGRPPHVELGATPRSDGTVAFWVRDDGPGVPPEARTQLLQPLGRIDTARAAGHGRGLSIARRIVEKLGGQLGFESERGRGSVFHFTLPAG
ncbi:MAG: sensor histidine kinase [Anaerolineae bacterium]